MHMPGLNRAKVYCIYLMINRLLFVLFMKIYDQEEFMVHILWICQDILFFLIKFSRRVHVALQNKKLKQFIVYFSILLQVYEPNLNFKLSMLVSEIVLYIIFGITWVTMGWRLCVVPHASTSSRELLDQS